MKTCLGSILIVPALIGLAITGLYHVSVNSELRFEEADTQEVYINTQRSYRPVINPRGAGEEAEAVAIPADEEAPATSSAPAASGTSR